MDSLVRFIRSWQVSRCLFSLMSSLTLVVLFSSILFGGEREILKVPNSEAKTEAEMKPYEDMIEHVGAKFEMVPIPSGTFIMGSPDDEADRKDDEGPQHEVKIDPFWMGKYEVTWDIYEIWMFDLDVQRRELEKVEANLRDKAADEYQLTQPTRPYADMTFGMGKRGYPAICMTQLSCRVFCKWLTEKTGRYYRLPTEAEWEYACRAGSKAAYHFGDDPEKLEDYGWFYDNSNEKYQKVGKKKPNAWGLYDMHGNVSEWVLDQHRADFYKRFLGKIADNPLAAPEKLYGRIVRGGSWDDDPDLLRSSARVVSVPAWKQQDPQLPQSIWYHTDALHVGFRIVRPLYEPSTEEKKNKWDKHLPFQDRKKGR